MQSFRNNLITPELARKLIESQFDEDNILSGTSSYFSKKETKKDRKRRRKLHDKEEKKLQYLLKCIFETEFWADECDWSNSLDVYVGRLGDGRVKIDISITFRSRHPFEELYYERYDCRSTPSFVNASRWAFEAMDFFSKIQIDGVLVCCDGISIDTYLPLVDKEEVERYRSEFLNASLEVKKS